MKIRYTLYILCFLSFTKAWAQTECGNVSLQEAQKQYNTGHFETVAQLLNSCLSNKGFNQQEKEQAYKLLSMSALATDSLARANEYATQLLELNPGFEALYNDPPHFVKIITDLKLMNQGGIVSSVSKKNEDVRKAPATVSIITDEDIVKRGYTDIEQIFHDMSGFDISRGSGAAYTTLYQRGYRSITTDRTLLLVDGIEQNDLVSNNAIISRQYPLSNIKRIEVVYGPASTIYGSNAYVGVINIVTKDNYELLSEGKNFGVNVQSAYGSYNTKNVDATITARSKDISVSVTGNYYTSNGMDLSNDPNYQFNLDNINYAKILNLTGTAAATYVSRHTSLPATSNYYTISKAANGTVNGISLTNAGIQQAYNLDARGLAVGNDPLGINNFTNTWYLRAKVQTSGGFTIGVETYRMNESLAGWYTPIAYVFRQDQNANRWVNFNTNIFMIYEKKLGDKFYLTNITSYRVDAINGATNYQTFEGYYNNTFSFQELSSAKQSHIDTTYYFRSSNQLENETRLLWQPSNKFDVISGFDFRSSLIQIDYAKSTKPDPEENGTIGTSGILGANYFRILNFGLYSQGTYRYNKELNLIFGGRFDNNKIRQNGGYGTVFNYRLGAIYSPGKFIFKATYATAFEDASAFNKYATNSTRQLANPNLQPEHVKDLDLSVNYQATRDFSINVVGYNANYSNVVGSVVVPYNGSTTTQFQNLGQQHIKGIQAETKYTFLQYSLWANYTYTDPIDGTTHLRISDIASNNANLGITGTYYKKFQATLISNYIGERLSGAGTYGSSNPITSFPAVNLYHVNLSYAGVAKGLTLQFKVSNIFDTQYYSPGVRDATGGTGTYASEYPQPGRTYTVKLLYKL